MQPGHRRQLFRGKTLPVRSKKIVLKNKKDNFQIVIQPISANSIFQSCQAHGSKDNSVNFMDIILLHGNLAGTGAHMVDQLRV
jgi:hypothetical protein